MKPNALLAFIAALTSAVLAFVPLLERRRTAANWGFSVGMLVLTAQSLFDGLSLQTADLQEVVRWQTFALGAKACLPAAWIYFSLVYSRGNYREFLRAWRLPLLVAALLPAEWLVLLLSGSVLIGVAALPDSRGLWWVAYSVEARVFVALLLLAGALILANLEKTIRSAVGVTQWRIKFVVLGLGAVFGVRIYTLSQVLLFSGHDLTPLVVDAGSLLIGCLLIALAYLRHGLGGIDVYPSRAVLQSSVTVFLVGGYLVVVGVLGRIAARIEGAQHFQVQMFVVLMGLVVLVVLLFSDRVRQQVGRFVSRHFQRPQHDFRRVWTLLTRCMFEARDEGKLCASAARLISETFQVLSVTFYVADESGSRLTLGASTSPLAHEAAALTGGGLEMSNVPSQRIDSELRGYSFNLEKEEGLWFEALRQAAPRQFPSSGDRFCVPLITGERRLGLVILADRVNGVPYTVEELDLLACIADQVTAGLLNLRLTGDLMQAKEMEAFQTMSTFFVHDLKNAAYSLGLMLENLPVHFDDPEFRADALRGIGSTAGRINYLIERLGTLRRNLEAAPAPLDFNQLVAETLDALPEAPPDVEIHRDLRPLPKVSVDHDQIQSVLTNLMLNARDALERGGCIRVETDRRDEQAVLTVSDDGCGMSAEFLRESLFRPFHTTKKKGLGIGMFQSKMIIEANHGSIQVESEVGKGTTFKVGLPLAASA